MVASLLATGLSGVEVVDASSDMLSGISVLLGILFPIDLIKVCGISSPDDDSSTTGGADAKL